MTPKSTFYIITLSLMKKKRNNNTIENIGHLHNEIDMDGLESLEGTKVGNIEPQVGRFVFTDCPGAILLASDNADRFDSFLTSTVSLTLVCRAKFSFADVGLSRCVSLLILINGSLCSHGRAGRRLKENLNTYLTPENQTTVERLARVAADPGVQLHAHKRRK